MSSTNSNKNARVRPSDLPDGLRQLVEGEFSRHHFERDGSDQPSPMVVNPYESAKRDNFRLAQWAYSILRRNNVAPDYSMQRIATEKTGKPKKKGKPQEHRWVNRTYEGWLISEDVIIDDETKKPKPIKHEDGLMITTDGKLIRFSGSPYGVREYKYRDLEDKDLPQIPADLTRPRIIRATTGTRADPRTVGAINREEDSEQQIVLESNVVQHGRMEREMGRRIVRYLVTHDLIEQPPDEPDIQ